MSVAQTSENPELSVVLASQNARASVTECLRAIESQANRKTVEIIVVDNSTDGTGEIIARDFPYLKVVQAPKDKLIPQLWGIGIDKSTGSVVALTTTHFVPAKNWIGEILKIYETAYSAAAVGGAVENDERAGIVSWAIYFCRYSRFSLPFGEENTEDFAADNASYRREALEQVKRSMHDGFWEVFVHQAMLNEEMRLLLTPKIVVFHRDSFTFSDFMRQRFLHGVEFGRTRASSIPNAERLWLIMLSPLIPLVYLYRINRRVMEKKRNIGKYLISLPVLILFLISWSTGEFYGYLRKSE